MKATVPEENRGRRPGQDASARDHVDTRDLPERAKANRKYQRSMNWNRARSRTYHIPASERRKPTASTVYRAVLSSTALTPDHAHPADDHDQHQLDECRVLAARPGDGVVEPLLASSRIGEIEELRPPGASDGATSSRESAARHRSDVSLDVGQEQHRNSALELPKAEGSGGNRRTARG
jgi:hypothetical protein